MSQYFFTSASQLKTISMIFKAERVSEIHKLHLSKKVKVFSGAPYVCTNHFTGT
jgi:hypothetical protein